MTGTALGFSFGVILSLVGLGLLLMLLPEPSTFPSDDE